MTEKVKARSFAFIEMEDGPAFSVCFDDGRHFYIGMTYRQAALINADSGNYIFREVAKQRPGELYE